MPEPVRRLASPGGRRDEQLRLMTKVARLYHEHGVLQPEIARRLHISQARVSRLLKQARAEGIVRTTVVVPEGVRTGLEDELERAYGLREAVVVECFDTSEEGIAYELGVSTAAYLEASLTGGDVVGMSSWSATLLAAVDAMRPYLARGGRARRAALRRGRQPLRRGSRRAAQPALRRRSRAPGRRSCWRRASPTSAQAREALMRATGTCGRRWRRSTRSRSRSSASARSSPRACCRAAATSSPRQELEALGAQGRRRRHLPALLRRRGRARGLGRRPPRHRRHARAAAHGRPVRRRGRRRAQVRGDPRRPRRRAGSTC